MNIKVIFPPGATRLSVNGLHQWDYGRKIEIHADDLPALVEVHFACDGMEEAVVRSCAVINGVAEAAVPDLCLEQTTPVTAWVYEVGETSGETVKTIILPIIARAKPQPSADIPEDVSDKYTEAIAAMDALVAECEQTMQNAVDELASRVDTTKEGIAADVLNDLRTNEELSVPYADYADQALDAETANVLRLISKQQSASGVNSVSITEPGLYLVEFIYGSGTGVSVIGAIDEGRESAGTSAAELTINGTSACAMALLDRDWTLFVHHPGATDTELCLPITAVYKIAELRKVASA